MATKRRTCAEGLTAAAFRTAKSGTDREFGLAVPLSFPARPRFPGEFGALRLLHLLRHAKSSWDDPTLTDHERPLAPRGLKASQRIADHVAQSGIAPELVLCSTALRTRQTLAALLPVLGGDVDIRLEDALYRAGPHEVLARVREADDAISSLLVIGHNPTLHELALFLSGHAEALDRFPTGALASLAVPTAWADLGEGGAELEGFVVPREL
jgi:phosphohistidine phosphatase